MAGEVGLNQQFFEMLLQRVAACSRGANHFTDCDATALARRLEDLRGDHWQGCHHEFLALHFFCQATLLLLHGAHEEVNPSRKFGASVRIVDCVWRKAG